jgi:tRNA modification GTPase
VGLVRLSGPRALELLQRVCRLQRPVPRRMHAVRLRQPLGGELLDQALVCYMPGPASYTGEDVVEVHGHGGSLNLQRIVTLFIELGARQARPGEFTRRAFLNGRLDLTQAEAVAQIVAARSERALSNAQATLAGALGRRVRQLQQGLVQLAGLLEAAVDFAEETAPELRTDELVQRHLELEHDLSTLAQSYTRGRRLDGVTVALVGPVNAGKSSLFNRLLGGERALVAEEPGTTRDYLEAETSWRGQRVTLIDTAGQRPDDQLSGLERAGQALAAPVLARCDLHLLVLDLTRTPTEPVPPGGVVAANKADLLTPQQQRRWQHRLAIPTGAAVVLTSARTGQGLDELRERVLSCLLPEGGEPETVQVTQQRQWEALIRAGTALTQGREALQASLPPEVVAEHCRDALEQLGQLTGEQSTDAVLDAVFSRFCIGK